MYQINVLSAEYKTYLLLGAILLIGIALYAIINRR